jgi:hypothetical protein
MEPGPFEAVQQLSMALIQRNCGGHDSKSSCRVVVTSSIIATALALLSLHFITCALSTQMLLRHLPSPFLPLPLSDPLMWLGSNPSTSSLPLQLGLPLSLTCTISASQTPLSLLFAVWLLSPHLFYLSLVHNILAAWTLLFIPLATTSLYFPLPHHLRLPPPPHMPCWPLGSTLTHFSLSSQDRPLTLHPDH